MELKERNFPFFHSLPRLARRPLLPAAGAAAARHTPPVSVGPQGVALPFNWHVPSISRLQVLPKSQTLGITDLRPSRRNVENALYLAGALGRRGAREGAGPRRTLTDPPRLAPSSSPKMAATMKKAAAEDVNVTFEDQQKINKFARNTSRITELKEEIEVKKKQLQNLEDACEDIMLADDDCLMIPYQIGDVFISHSQEETQEMLEEAKKNLQEEIDALESRVASIQRVLADLKVQLYAKFGSNINLEADES